MKKISNITKKTFSKGIQIFNLNNLGTFVLIIVVVALIFIVYSYLSKQKETFAVKKNSPTKTLSSTKNPPCPIPKPCPVCPIPKPCPSCPAPKPCPVCPTPEPCPVCPTKSAWSSKITDEDENDDLDNKFNESDDEDKLSDNKSISSDDDKSDLSDDEDDSLLNIKSSSKFSRKKPRKNKKI